MKNVYVGEGNLAGKGVYANKDFKKGDVVISYNLTPLTEEESKNLPDDEKIFTHSHHEKVYLYGEPERYVNHSETPNTHQDLEEQKDIALVDIKKGEMITTDAGKDDV